MKYDIYAEVTSRIIDQLEKGMVPWKSQCFATVGFPANFASGKQYRGINVFLLASLHFTSRWFLTYKQAQALGGNVRRGEHGALVIKCGKCAVQTPEGSEVIEDEKTRRYLKAYTVFNAAQIEGIFFGSPS